MKRKSRYTSDKFSKINLRHLVSFLLVTSTTVGFGVECQAQITSAEINNQTRINPQLIAQQAAYTLGTGDRVRVDVFDVPEYSGEYLVLIDGSLNLPIIGSVNVRGLTLPQATQLITREYAPYVRRPIVTVSLLEPRPIKVAVAGEVNRPGSFKVNLEGSEFPTLTQAITLAGGTTGAADVSSIQIRRQAGSGEVVNLLALIRSGDLSQDPLLRDGDEIFVPTRNNIDPGELRQIEAANFVPQNQPREVAIVGEVSRPGTYTVGGEIPPTVTRAIQSAGGVTPMAEVSSIIVRRPTRQGGEQIIAIDLLQLLRQGDLTQDLILQQGDTILIPTASQIDPAENRQLADATFGIRAVEPVKVAIVGEVTRPGSYTINAGGGNAQGAGSGSTPPTLTEAIQTAGGITALADVRQVEVRRPTRQGTERVISINLWQLLQSGDLAQDVLLQDGDTIVIPTATAIDPAEAANLAEASFSPERIQVNIVGEVKNPGSVEVPPNTPLNQAILAAGGFDNTRARRGSVELIRLNPNGTVAKRNIPVDFSEGIDQENNPPLRPGDVVVVNRSTLTRVSDTLGTILSPVGRFFSLFNFLRIFD